MEKRLSFHWWGEKNGWIDQRGTVLSARPQLTSVSDPSNSEQTRLPTGGSGESVSEGDSGSDSSTDSSADGDKDGGTAPDPATPDTCQERIEVALDLLAHLEHDELGLPDAIDRIETVTTNPTLTREILDEAEKRGIIEREDGRLLTRRGGTFVQFESQVVKKEGDFECRRCGAGLSTGHFVQFNSGELGPFGSSCIRKVMGRE